MKKLIAILVLFVSIILVAGGMKSVFAAAATDNRVVPVYDDGSALTGAAVGNDSANNFQQTVIGDTSGLLSKFQIAYGAELVPDGPAKDKLLTERPYLRYGLVQNSAVMMTNAFLNGPTTNIPGYYAQMFLPKQLIENGGSAYAAWSSPPETATSSSFMKDMGLNKLWGLTFTIAMSILVIILIIAGFMIMFRSKAGGQVVVTVSLALQNAVIGAVLALASFALGAFFLNLSKYLVMVVALLFQGVYAGKMDVIYINGPWKLFTDFSYVTITGTAAQDANTWWKSAQQGFLGQVIGQNSTAPSFINNLIANATIVGQTVAFGTTFLIAKLVIGAAVLFTTIKIFWAVLSTYIKMIIDIVLAPLLFMISAIPGKQSGFSTWLKRMFQNSIAIPIMFAFVNIAAYMAYNVSVAGSGCTDAGKSILTCVTGGLIPGGSAGGSDWLIAAVGPSAIVALVILNMVPAVPTMVNEMFNQKGDMSKAWGDAKKSLQSMPGIGGLFQ